MASAIAWIVGIGFLLIAFVISFSVFGGAWEKVFEALDEQRERQNDQADPSIANSGNLAKDTGTRVCNLKINVVGSASGVIFSDDLKLFVGDFGLFANHDKSIIRYQWYCTGLPSTASWFSFYGEKAISDLEQQNLLRSEGQTIRIKLDGESKTTGKLLVGKQSENSNVLINQFQDITEIPQGAEFPVGWNVRIFLYDVTEDDYNIEFWSEDFRINDQPVSTHIKYDLCRPSKTSC